MIRKIEQNETWFCDGVNLRWNANKKQFDLCGIEGEMYHFEDAIHLLFTNGKLTPYVEYDSCEDEPHCPHCGSEGWFQYISIDKPEYYIGCKCHDTRARTTPEKAWAEWCKWCEAKEWID